MNSDSFLRKGNHKICEDYAVAGDGYAIVSDGCSSSAYTDIGSRVICMVAQEVISCVIKETHDDDSLLFDTYTPIEYDFLRSYIMEKSAKCVKEMGLPLSCLDATLLIVFALGDWVYIYTYGDGYISVTCNNKIRRYYKFEFNKNAPYYPGYCLNEGREKTYREDVGGYDGIIGSAYRCIDSSFSGLKIGRGDWLKTKSMHPDDEHILRMGKEVISNVVLMSDGVSSFRFGTRPVPDLEVLRNFTDFKMMQGEFVYRRLNATMKQLTKAGFSHYDDLGIAGLDVR